MPDFKSGNITISREDFIKKFSQGFQPLQPRVSPGAIKPPPILEGIPPYEPPPGVTPPLQALTTKAIWRNVRTGEEITQAEKNKRYPTGYEAEIDQWTLTREAAGQLPAVFKVFGEALTKVPKQTGASILQAIQGQGGASVVDRDWADRFIQSAFTDIEEFSQRASEMQGALDLPINLTDLAQLPQNIGFSMTSMVAGLGVGAPIALLPVPGARVAAWAAGTAASGAVAYRMSTYQIMQQYLEAKNEEKKTRTGKGLTQVEEDQLKKDFESKARQYGLWEAVPEAISNLAFAKILTTPLSKMAGKVIAAKIVGKISLMYGQEFLTETITQKGQSKIEVEAGLRAGNISVWEAFKEVAPQTFLLTTIMAGSGQVAVGTYNKINESLKNEMGEGGLITTIQAKLREIISDETGAISFPVGGEGLEEAIRAGSPEIAPTAPTTQIEPHVTPEVTPTIPKTKLQKDAEAWVADEGIEDMSGNPIEVNPDGTVTLYHRTSKANADAVTKTGKFISKENTDETFFSNKPTGQAEGYGDAIVTVKVPAQVIRINDAFRDEIHVAVSNKQLSKAVIAPQIKPIGEVTEGITPQEVIKPPVSVKPIVTPKVAPKPVSETVRLVARRDEIGRLLAIPIKNLPAGTKKIELRQELAAVNKALIPAEKKLRQKIMATAIARSISPTQRVKIFKDIGGSRYLSKIGLDKLERILPAIQTARPQRIRGKVVITPKTEAEIQSVKSELLESGQLKEGDYPAILKVLKLPTDKYVSESLFISERSGRTIIKAMRRKSLMGFATIEDVVSDLVKVLGPPAKLPPIITGTALEKSATRRFQDKLSGVLNRTYRVERILLKLDEFTEGGLFQKTFYKPINEATSQKMGGVYGKIEELRKLLKTNKLDIGKLTTVKAEIAPDVVLTPAEKIGVYLHSLNKDNLKHLKEGNKFSDELIETIKSSLTDAEKKVADWLSKYFAEEGSAISQARLYVEGKPLSIVENYFPIRLEHRAQPEIDYWGQIAKTDSLDFVTQWASAGIPKGFLKERTGEATQAVDLDALGIFLNHLEMVEHYKAFAPVIADLQLIMKNYDFKSSLISKAGGSVYSVLSKWLEQVAKINPLNPSGHGEAILRTLRVNAVTAVLGLNITTAMKQFPSFVSGMAEIGEVAAIKGLFTFMAHPVETRQLIKQFDIQIYRRSFEREIAEARKMKGVSGVLGGKLSPREAFMFLTVSMDRIAVSSLWRGGFDDFLRKNPDDIKGAAEYANRVIRKTQPYFDVKDLPEYWRSGEFMKALTIFTNQLNQYWNYYTFDIVGKTRTGKISGVEALRRTFWAFIIPALMIGAITRSDIPKNTRELVKDLASMYIATIPIVGSWITSGLKGFSDSGLITTEILDRIQDLSQKVNKAEWDKVALTLPELAGYAIGVPVAQPKRTFKAIINLAQGKTDDWMELIWGEYTRKLRLNVGLEKAISELKWESLFDDYYNTDSDKRYDYRKRNPDTDAALFITGKVTTLQSTQARAKVRQIVKEYEIDTSLISGWAKEFGGGTTKEPSKAPTGVPSEAGRKWAEGALK